MNGAVIKKEMIRITMKDGTEMLATEIRRNPEGEFFMVFGTKGSKKINTEEISYMDFVLRYTNE